MKKTGKIIVAGLGEVGKPLYELLSRQYEVIGMDMGPFHRAVESRRLACLLSLPDSRLHWGDGPLHRGLQAGGDGHQQHGSMGTTRAVAERTGAAVVNSPVRGKHARMLEDMGKYTKFVGAMDAASGASRPALRVHRSKDQGALRRKPPNSPSSRKRRTSA